MMRTFTRLGATMVVVAIPATRVTDAAELRSAWPKDARVWAGPEYWANPLQDWRVAKGRLECFRSGDNRNVHLLTRELRPQPGSFRMSVRIGRLTPPGKVLDGGWVGFRIGARGQWHDYRDSAIRGKGIDAGMMTDGRLFIGKPSSSASAMPESVPRGKWKVTFTDTHGGQLRPGGRGVLADDRGLGHDRPRGAGDRRIERRSRVHAAHSWHDVQAEGVREGTLPRESGRAGGEDEVAAQTSRGHGAPNRVALP